MALRIYCKRLGVMALICCLMYQQEWSVVLAGFVCDAAARSAVEDGDTSEHEDPEQDSSPARDNDPGSLEEATDVDGDHLRDVPCVQPATSDRKPIECRQTRKGYAVRGSMLTASFYTLGKLHI